MRRHFALISVLLALLPCLLSLHGGDLAAHGERVVPAPAECRVAPRPLADLTAAVRDGDPGLPGAAGQVGSSDSTPFIMPPGASVDDPTRSAIVATTLELLACENAGDQLRTYALHSDAFLRRQLGRLAATSPDQAWLDTLSAPPAPRPETARGALLAIESVRLLADGRVGALVHVDRPDDARPEERAFVSFVQRDGRWLVDEMVEEQPDNQPVTASATLKDTAGTTVGTAELTQTFGGQVTVAVTLDGAPPGGHAVHVHAVGACDPAGDEPFASAGDHFDPAGATHPRHAGDLGNMGTDTAGYGEHWTVTDRFTLSPSPSSLMDGDGSALAIHAGMDDEATAPEGNSGPRIACGVLTLLDRGEPAAEDRIDLTMLALGGLIAGSGGLLAVRGWRARRRAATRQRPVGRTQSPPSSPG